MTLEEKIELSNEVIETALATYSRTALVASGGKDSTVMLDLVCKFARENGYSIPRVLLCDPIPMKENVEFCKLLIKHYKLKKYNWYEEFSRKYESKVEVGKDKVKCCYWLKIKPLRDFLKKYRIEALFVAIRRDEHPERAKENYISKRDNPEHVRVHPILHFTWLDIWQYIKQFNLIFNPLYLKGFTSLGCKPCTSAVTAGFSSIDEIIEFVKRRKAKERAGRDIDKELVMERLRKLGYY